jgi:hypothetical protein
VRSFASKRPSPAPPAPRTEGLRDVIVGADAEAEHPIGFLDLAVNMMMGTVVSARSRFATSNPSMRGRPRSSTTRFGGRADAGTSASSPVPRTPRNRHAEGSLDYFCDARIILDDQDRLQVDPP